MTKALIAFLVAALLALGAVGYVAKRQATQIGALKTERDTAVRGLEQAAKQRKTDASTLAARASANAATARKTAALEQALDTALRANREWADQPVPEDVRKRMEETP